MKNQLILLSLCVVLASTTGTALASAAHFYTLYQKSVEQNIARNSAFFERAASIVSIDSESVRARILDPYNSKIETLQARINASAEISRQDPVFKDDILIGFTDKAQLPLSALVPGMNVYLKLFTEADGSFTVVTISTGVPFPRF